MGKKLNFIGLITNSLLLIWGILIVLTYKTTNVILSSNSKTIDLVFSLLYITSMTYGYPLVAINEVETVIL